MTTTFSNDNRPETVDAAKCRFNLATVQFMEGDGAGEGSIKHPIRMLARTDQPVYHWYWGRVVHDIQGIKFHKDSIVVDYCHDDHVIMGYLDKFEASQGQGFFCEGALVRRPGSMADEVLTNAENDVPYEASIFWHPEFGMVIEEVREGASVEVNGFQFQGPGVVIRECVLHAVSVCPHGHDPGTETQFNQSNQSVSLTYKEPEPMPTGENKPATNPGENGEAKFSQEQFDALTSRIECLETKLAKETGQPQDLESALTLIDELKTKLAAKEQPGGGEETGDGETEFSVKDELAAIEKRLEAKFSHAANSDGSSVSGDGGESSSKPSMASAFSYHGQKPGDNEA